MFYHVDLLDQQNTLEIWQNWQCLFERQFVRERAGAALACKGIGTSTPERNYEFNYMISRY